MPSWLSKAWSFGKRVLGKVRGGLEKGLRLFQKAKAGYGEMKQRAENLPFVGEAARNLIAEGERKVMDYAREKSGGIITPQNIAVAEGVARRVARNLPREEMG